MRLTRSNQVVALAAMLLCLCTGCKRQQPQVVAASTSAPVPTVPAPVATP